MSSSQSFELLSQVHELLRSGADDQYHAQTSFSRTKPTHIHDNKKDNEKGHYHGVPAPPQQQVSQYFPAAFSSPPPQSQRHAEEQQQRHHHHPPHYEAPIVDQRSTLPAKDLAYDRVGHYDAAAPQRTQEIVEQAVTESLDPDLKAVAVIDALVATARHNTDLTELDIAARRVRQSEMEQVESAIVILEDVDRYLRRRCNALYDKINDVNDQQALLVRCLEEALQASIKGLGVAEGGSVSPPLMHGDDSASVPGSIRGRAGAGPGPTVISSASSLSGANNRGTGGSTGASGRQLPQTSSQPQPTSSALVTPYTVMGGPLNRDTFASMVDAHRGIPHH